MNMRDAKEFVEMDGSHCPSCGSYHIDYVKNFDCGKMSVHCHKCGKDWYEIWRLVGIGFDGKELFPHDNVEVNLCSNPCVSTVSSGS